MEFLCTGWTPSAHSAIIVVAGYAVLILVLRITGARTIARMTPMDFVLAVTIGSAFGRTITASEVPSAQTLLGRFPAHWHPVTLGRGARPTGLGP